MERLYLVLAFGIEELSKRSISFNMTPESLKRGGCARGSMRHPRPLTECVEVSFRVKGKITGNKARTQRGRMEKETGYIVKGTLEEEIQ